MRHQVGDRLGERYELREPIAVGGMGEVWRAVDQVLGRDVAVKVLKPEYTSDPGFLDRFRAEARHTAALAHPNIAAVYDYGETTDGGRESAYLVMELVPGEPLSDELARQGRLSPDRAMDLLGQAALGLAAAHAAGVVHRDVKPGNLLITPDGHVKVTDFGIARAVDQVPMTATGQVMGTAQYLAPEQAMGRGATPASDVYALGVVAYEAVSGSRPFGGDSAVAQAMAHVNDTPTALPDDVPAPVRALIETAMAKEASQRPADGAAFAAAAEQARAGRMPPGALAAGAAAGSATAATRAMPADSTAVMGAAGTATAPGPAGTRVMPVTTPDARPSAARSSTTTSRPGAPPRRRRATGPLIALVALLLFVLVGALAAGGLFGGEDPQTLPSEPAATETTPATEPPASQPPAPTSEPPQTTQETTPPTTEPEPAGVEVVAADYVGRKLKDVTKDLEKLGLEVEAVPVAGSDAKKDEVTAVAEGTYAEGDTVRVEYSEGDAGSGDNKGGDN